MPSAAEIIELLGQPAVIEQVDFEAERQEMRDDLVALFPSLASYVDLESEPIQMLLQAFAYKAMVLRARVNDAARQSNSIWFATGATLDYHAGFYDLTRLVGETDSQLRERIRLAVIGRSTGGTVERYRLIALSSSPQVSSAYVWRDGSGPVVNVSIRSTSPGGAASPTLLTTVRDALNAEAVRMVNDTLVVMSSVQNTVQVEANVWLLPTAPLSLIDDLPGILSTRWTEQSGLGFNMTRSWLTSRLMVSGVQRVEIVSPAADQVIEPSFSLAMGTPVINFMGRDF